MKSYYISYYGGACGDFLAFLLASGDSSIDDITYKNDMFNISYGNGTNIKIALDAQGAIKGSWQFSKISMRYRKHLFNDELFNMFSNNNTEEVVKKLEEQTADFDTTHLNDFEVTAGHEIILFSDCNSIDGFNDFCRLNKFNDTILLTMNNKKSKQITYINSKYKNNNTSIESIDYRNYPDELQFYSDMMNTIECNKIEVIDLFDKEKLKKIIYSLTRKKWNDKFYDLIFDIYMSKQQLKDIL
jgi:hypothetical protein